MKTIAFFNNKGGVGKTTLVYHVAWMLSEMGVNVVAADFDPQSNLTSMCFSDEENERLFDPDDRPTVAASFRPLLGGTGDLRFFEPLPVGGRVWLIPGDLDLSAVEDDLVKSWGDCMDGRERGFRITSALHRILGFATKSCDAEIALIDVGPNFGALNRAALIAADAVVIPVAADLFSVRGLTNVGTRLKTWRNDWTKRLGEAPAGLDFTPPKGAMSPSGYVVSRLTRFARGPVYAFQRWIERIPEAYRRTVDPAPDLTDEQLALGRLKDYRSLVAMAQEARKPMFKLKPGDGAIGGHQAAVTEAYLDFSVLTRDILARTRMGAGLTSDVYAK